MPVADYWNLVLEDLARIVSSSQYQAWLENLEFVSTTVRGTRLNLSVGSRFGKEYIQKKLLTQVKNSVQKYFPQVTQIEFEIRPPKVDSSSLSKLSKEPKEKLPQKMKVSTQENSSNIFPTENQNLTQNKNPDSANNSQLGQALQRVASSLDHLSAKTWSPENQGQSLLEVKSESSLTTSKFANAFEPFNTRKSKTGKNTITKNQNSSTDLTQKPPEDSTPTNFDRKDWQDKGLQVSKTGDEPSAFPSHNLNNLNPKYTFENLVVSGYNELAVSVSKSILRQLGTLYNPVFVYSKVGLGKTHLLQAIGQKALENEPSLKIKYATCETFFNHYLTAIQKNQSTQFRHYYRNVDLLLLDDIQFINGKNSTQEAFFHTFNELHQQNKQIIITSDKPPEQLGLVEERLISRFKWGMVVDITDPGMEDRLAILQDKITRLNILLSPEQILQIAQTITTNVRDLEGVLNKLMAKTAMTGSPIEQNWLDQILQTNHSETKVIINKTPEKALQIVAKMYGTNQNELISKNRDKNVSTARQIIMYLWHRNFDLSLPIIGKMLGRDHTTILHGTQKIQKELTTNPELALKIAEITKLLG